MPHFEKFKEIEALLEGLIAWMNVNLSGSQNCIGGKLNAIYHTSHYDPNTCFLLSHMGSFGAKTPKPTKVFGTALGGSVA